MCLMGNHSKASESEDDDTKSFCQVCAPIAQTVYDQMQITMRKHESFKLTLKEKSDLISSLEDKVKIQHEVIETLRTDNAVHN